MYTDHGAIGAEFLTAARDHRLVNARMAVLNCGASVLSAIAMQITAPGGDNSGSVDPCGENSRIAAAARLTRMAAELVGSIALLLQARRTYPTAILLRELIVIGDALTAAACEPTRLATGTTSRAVAHPVDATPLLGEYAGDPAPFALLLPQCAWHCRRVWEALAALWPQLDLPPHSPRLSEIASPITTALSAWERREPPAIVESMRRAHECIDREEGR